MTQQDHIKELEKRLEMAKEEVKTATEMIGSAGYTMENDKRCMDGNEYVWIDRCIKILKTTLEKLNKPIGVEND